MKILHLTHAYTPWGGIEQYVLAVASLLQEYGHSNVVAHWQEHPDTIQEGVFPGIQIPSVNGKVAAADLRHFLEQMRQEKVELVFLHAAVDAQLVREIAASVPTVAYVHGFIPTCPGFAKLHRRGDQVCTRPFGPGCAAMIYLRRCSEARDPRTVFSLVNATRSMRNAYRTIPRILVASKYMHDLLIQNGFEAGRIECLPPHFEALRPALEPQKDPPLVLFAGRLEIEKGLPYLLEAVARVRSPFQLMVSGDGTQRSACERLAHQLGIADRVSFQGWSDQAGLRSLYERATLVVFPSIFPEPFGKVGIEAMAHARPVVAFEVGGVPDWLQDGENGFLVPPLDVDRLANRIDILLKDRDLACRLGLNGQKRIAAQISPQQYASRLLSAFESARLSFS